jgi:hypothetical protein
MTSLNMWVCEKIWRFCEVFLIILEFEFVNHREFLYDFLVSDDKKFKKITGVSNEVKKKIPKSADAVW